MSTEFIITTSISIVSLAVSIWSIVKSKKNEQRINNISKEDRSIHFGNEYSAFKDCTDLKGCKGYIDSK